MINLQKYTLWFYTETTFMLDNRVELIINDIPFYMIQSTKTNAIRYANIHNLAIGIYADASNLITIKWRFSHDVGVRLTITIYDNNTASYDIETRCPPILASKPALAIQNILGKIE